LIDLSWDVFAVDIPAVDIPVMNSRLGSLAASSNLDTQDTQDRDMLLDTRVVKLTVMAAVRKPNEGVEFDVEW